LCLGTAVWEGFPGAATRVLLPLTLAFNILAVRDRAALVWLLVGNLAVVNGTRSLRDVPHDRQEIAAARIQDAAVIARADDRWDVDAGWRHTSAASGPASAIDIETWPHDDRFLQIETTIRGRAPVVLTIAQDGAILWRNTIFGKPLRVRIPCHVHEGHAHLEFAADLTGLPPGLLAATRDRILTLQEVRLQPPPGD
jgi:hypothetical protein